MNVLPTTMLWTSRGTQMCGQFFFGLTPYVDNLDVHFIKGQLSFSQSGGPGRWICHFRMEECMGTTLLERGPHLRKGVQAAKRRLNPRVQAGKQRVLIPVRQRRKTIFHE